MKSIMNKLYILKKQGWVGRSKFAELLDRVPSIHILALAKKYGVRIFALDAPNYSSTGVIHLFRPEDAVKVPPKKQNKLDRLTAQATGKGWFNRKEFAQKVNITYHQVPAYVRSHNIGTKIVDSKMGIYVYNLNDVNRPVLKTHENSVKASRFLRNIASIRNDVSDLDINEKKLKVLLEA